jgi:hypothetical protein
MAPLKNGLIEREYFLLYGLRIREDLTSRRPN